MSLLALYGWGGWLVSTGLMPLRVMISGIGFTFSLLYATQVCDFAFLLRHDQRHRLHLLAAVRHPGV